MTLRYLSVCSGIEAATVAWHPLGFQPVAFSEIEAFPSAVLAHHYPTVPNWGDMTRFKEWPDADVDVLVGGTPCQSFSVAGLRGGMADPRGNLALVYLALADRYRPRWLVWENVPGVLSSGGGRDFGAILGGMVELGYGVAYRVLDAQYFGLAQRRRRVFVVGCLGDWRRAAAVLFEPASLRGDSAPRREAGQGFAASTAPSLTASGRGVERCGESRGQDPVIAVELLCASTGQAGAEIGADMAPTLSCNHEAPYIAHALRGEGFDASEDGTGRGTPLVPVTAGTLSCNTGPNGNDAGNFACNQAVDAGHLVPVPLLAAGGGNANSAGIGRSGDPMFSLDTTGAMAVAYGELHGRRDFESETFVAQAMNLRGREGGAMPEMADVASLRAASGGSSRSYVAAMQVRRLTPRECERLQGFPDDYTLIPYRNKPASDGPRYKALGNSMAVPVMRWIGARINQEDV